MTGHTAQSFRLMQANLPELNATQRNAESACQHSEACGLRLKSAGTFKLKPAGHDSVNSIQ
ncbi:hypothetical protein ACJ2_25980 [Pantoea sp. QMID2]|nr:hypothetical protein ACJ3_29570 [Pantoea sp. QMID3]GME58549.1 hypothetical protein ACJ2_25980 [Pantoea sp. QMID2]